MKKCLKFVPSNIGKESVNICSLLPMHRCINTCVWSYVSIPNPFVVEQLKNSQLIEMVFSGKFILENNNGAAAMKDLGKEWTYYSYKWNFQHLHPRAILSFFICIISAIVFISGGKIPCCIKLISKSKAILCYAKNKKKKAKWGINK